MGRQALKKFAKMVRTGEVAEGSGEYRLGIDLGTANIVLSVVDGSNNPVAGAWRHSTVVRDGIVVDWLGAVRAVQELKEELTTSTGHAFDRAAFTIPPGIDEATVKVFANVVQAADLEVDEVVDEPVAAATALGITDGTIIDVGHGTTGVSLLNDGKVTLSIDEPTGGHHMTLVIAGAMGVDYEEAEKFKKTAKNANIAGPLVRPTLEKMATIAARALEGRDPGTITLVGGAASLPNATGVFSQVLGHPVECPAEPLFPTPLGVAMRRS